MMMNMNMLVMVVDVIVMVMVVVMMVLTSGYKINILVEKLIKSCFLFSLNFCSQSDPDLLVCVPPKLRDSASHSFMIRVAHNRKLN